MLSKTKVKKSLSVIICLALVLGVLPLALQTAQATGGDLVLECETPVPSGGSDMLSQSTEGITIGPYSEEHGAPLLGSPGITTTFDGFNFDDNSTENGGYVFIPPDPIGAAGTDRLIAVVNCMIEARNKTGGLLWRDSLEDFFTTLTPANFLFDPKVVWDHYENRFLVVALEKVDIGSNPDPGNTSRILLAVSKTATPATATSADWYYTAINGEESIGGLDYWADYPGFEVDEEAVYITTNIFAHAPPSGYGGARLWIVDKGVAAGFYGGGAASVTKHDPYASAGNAMTTMPAQVYGAGGIGGSGGTYLVGYNGLTAGGLFGNEYVQVVLVDNPLGATTFTVTNVLVGDIEDIGGMYGWPDLPDAPQSGTATDIEVNDRRALDAVWRNNQLWFTTTINPNSGSDAGETTAHWFRLDTSAWPPTAGDQGDIGGEDIATDTYTFFPALAVNNNGDVKYGFCASAATIYAGAYATVHLAGDAPGTVQASETVHAGVDWYVRTFGGVRNRWGDFTGAALDPTDDNVVWLFNQYAMARGTDIGGEDGRWGTAWARNEFQPLPDLEYGDAPDPTYPSLLASDGSRHSQSSVEWLGLGTEGKDYEPDANVPDSDQLDDGLVTTSIFAGLGAETVTFEVTDTLAPATDLIVNILIDLNCDGDWADAGEHVVQNQALSTTDPVNGDTFVSTPFSTVGATLGSTYLRITLSADPETVPVPWDGTMAFNGSAPFFCGETEDHLIDILETEEYLEFGDAPDPTYPSLLASDGARHLQTATEWLGLGTEGKEYETDADVPDADQLDDGLVTTMIAIGNPAYQVTFEVTDTSAPSDLYVNILIDLNADGDWTDAGEHVVQNQVVTTTDPVNGDTFVSTPFSTVGATVGPTWLRITLTRSTVPVSWDGTMAFNGSAPFDYGETEDYEVTLGKEDLEYGDAPDPTYPSLLASDGARHAYTRTEWLGLSTEGKEEEPDADQPDLDGNDDGLVTTTITAGLANEQVQFEVTDLNPGLGDLVVNILIDLNGDGDWADAGEHVVVNQPIPMTAAEGVFFSYPFSTIGATPGPTWLRITLTRSDLDTTNPWDGTMAGYAATIPFEYGETEDWEITIASPPEVIPPWIDVDKRVTPFEIWQKDSNMEPEQAKVTLTVTGEGQLVDVPNADIIFALDSSGSMDWEDPGNIRISGSQDFVDMLDPARDQVGVVSWDDGIDFSLGLTNDFALVKTNIGNVDSLGGTNLDAGLNEAIDLLDAGARPGTLRIIVFLTDGGGGYTPSGSPGSPADRAAAAGYKVYTIGLGGGVDPVPLQEIATVTGGKYCFAATAEDIVVCLDEILGEITNIAGQNVTVIDVLSSYINQENAFTIAPDSITANPDGTTTLEWFVGTLLVNETWTVSFNISSDECGDRLLVDVPYDSGVLYINYADEETWVPFRPVYINVLCPVEMEPARIIVRNLLIQPANTFPGQQVVISADVVNQGGIRGSKDIELVINGQVEQSTRVGVDPGAAQHITFYTSKTVPGTYGVYIEGQASAFNVLLRPHVTSTGAFEGLGTGAIIAIVVIGVIFLAGIIIVFIRVRR